MARTIFISPVKNLKEQLKMPNLIQFESIEQIPSTIKINQIKYLVIYTEDTTSYKTLSKIRMLKYLNQELKVLYIMGKSSPSLKTLFNLGIDLPLREELGFEKLSEILIDFIASNDISSPQSLIPKIKVEDLELDPNTRIVTRNLKSITLRKKEFDLLEFLMCNKGRVVSKAQILEQVWDYHFDAESKTVDVHISSLRSKIDKGFKRKYIKTVYGAGYTLDASR